MTLAILRSGFLNFASHLRTERGLVRAEGRDLRKVLQDLEKERHELTKYVDVIKQCNTADVKKELEEHYAKIIQKLLNDTIDIVNKDLLELNTKILNDIVKFHKDIDGQLLVKIRDYDAKLKTTNNAAIERAKKGATLYRLLFHQQIMDMLDKYAASLNSELATLASREGLTVAGIKMLGTESMVQTIRGETIKERKNVSKWKSSTSKAGKIDKQYLDNTEKQYMGALDKPGTPVKDPAMKPDDGPVTALNEFLTEIQKITQDAIILLMRLKDNVTKMLNDKSVITYDAISPANPPSIEQLTAPVGRGLGYPKKDGEEIKSKIAVILEKCNKDIEQAESILRLQLSKVAHVRPAKPAP